MSRHRLQLAAVLLLSVLVLAACQVQPEHYHRPSGPNRGGSGTASTPLAEGFDFYTQRRVINVKVGPKQYFPVRFPRFNAGVYARLNNNTCGLYDILHSPTSVVSSGPPPHVHYSDDEWFFQLGTGKLRMFTGQKPTSFYASQLPGYNAPASKMGSVLIGDGEDSSVLYSPKGNVHYFARETSTTEFLAVHAPGYSTDLLIDFFDKMTDAEQLMLYTGLYGVPHDMTARMVGATNETYRQARGPVDTGGARALVASLRRLQRLFDAGEACFSKK